MSKNVLVTGATKGLGLAIVRECLRLGFDVVGLARRPSKELAAICRSTPAPQRCVFVAADLADHARSHELVRTITAEHGPPFALVNNAALGRDGVLATMHDTDIEALVALNVLSPILLTKYVARAMLLRGAGRIVNVTSIGASSGFNGLSVYSATKAALVGFTRSLARELGPAHITVNAVAPGYMETEMTSAVSAERLRTIRRRSPLQRFVTVEEVAAAVGFLLGEHASGITGTTLTVDGGSTA